MKDPNFWESFNIGWLLYY